MGQREPDGAELRKAGAMRVKDAAGDVEVCDGVAVIEKGRVGPAPCSRGEREREGCDENGSPLGAADGAVSQGE